MHSGRVTQLHGYLAKAMAVGDLLTMLFVLVYSMNCKGGMQCMPCITLAPLCCTAHTICYHAATSSQTVVFLQCPF